MTQKETQTWWNSIRNLRTDMVNRLKQDIGDKFFTMFYVIVDDMIIFSRLPKMFNQK